MPRWGTLGLSTVFGFFAGACATGVYLIKLRRKQLDDGHMAALAPAPSASPPFVPEEPAVKVDEQPSALDQRKVLADFYAKYPGLRQEKA